MPSTTTRPAKRALVRRIHTSVLHGTLVGLCLLTLLTAGAAAAHFALAAHPAPTPAVIP